MLALTFELRQALLIQDFSVRNNALRRRLSVLKREGGACRETLEEFRRDVSEAGSEMERVFCSIETTSNVLRHQSSEKI
jgi:arylamine N-acetyltransferase